MKDEGVNHFDKEHLTRILRPFNPWWEDPENWYRKDVLIGEYESSAIKLLPRLYYHIKKNFIASGEYGIVTLRGPRRSGKTTIVKLLIKHLIEEHRVDPKSIFYVTLDYEGLENTRLTTILELISTIDSGEKFVFIDEASLYPDWARALKNVYDMGLVEYGKMKILVTGSHSMDIARVAGLLRGRQGRLAERFNLGGNLLHMPLRFSEFAEARLRRLNEYIGKELLRRPGVRFDIIMRLASGEVDRRLEKIYVEYFRYLADDFEAYLVHGGYPKAIKDYYERGRIDNTFYSSIAELLIKDAKRAGIEEEALKRVLKELVKPIRLSGLIDVARDQELLRLAGSRDKLSSCIDYLRTTWAFFFAYREEGASGSCTPNYQEPRKNYVLDPLIYYSIYSYLNNIADPFSESKSLLENGTFKGQMVESVIATHLLLAQQLFEHVPHVEYDKVLMYRRNGERGEVDFVLCIKKSGELHRLLIESKYRGSGFKVLKEPNKIVLTKDVLDVIDGMVYVPTPLFLLLF